MSHRLSDNHRLTTKHERPRLKGAVLLDAFVRQSSFPEHRAFYFLLFVQFFEYPFSNQRLLIDSFVFGNTFDRFRLLRL